MFGQENVSRILSWIVERLLSTFVQSLGNGCLDMAFTTPENIVTEGTTSLFTAG